MYVETITETLTFKFVGEASNPTPSGGEVRQTLLKDENAVSSMLPVMKASSSACDWLVHLAHDASSTHQAHGKELSVVASGYLLLLHKVPLWG